MKEFEDLMDRRPFLVNEVLLRRNVNEVVEWEKRVALFGDDDEKVWLQSLTGWRPQCLSPLSRLADVWSYSFHAVSHRSLRLTPRRLRPSILAKPPDPSTLSLSPLPSSTRRGGPRMPRPASRETNPTSTRRGRFLTKPSRCHSRRSMNSPRLGASGPKWSLETSKSSVAAHVAEFVVSTLMVAIHL